MLDIGVATFGDISVSASNAASIQLKALRDVVEQAVVADAAGIDFFGVGEHHRRDFAISAPEIVLAGIAGRTRRIRLNTAANVLAADDPVRVYQRFATLNAISGGRAEIVVGRGWFAEAFSIFGVSKADYDSAFQNKLSILTSLTSEFRMDFHEPYRYLIDKIAIIPNPGSDTRIRVWLAVGSTPESVIRAANFNLPIMIATIGGDAMRFRPLVDLYRAAFERLKREPLEVGIHSMGYLAENDHDAREEYWPHYKAYRDRIGAERNWAPIERSVFDAEVDKGSIFVGSPSTVADKIYHFAKTLGVNRFELRYSCDGLEHEKMIQCLHIFGNKVIPRLKDMRSVKNNIDH